MKRLLRADAAVYSMASIGVNTKPTFAVQVHPDSGRSGDPYMKLYDNKGFSSEGNKTRVSLLKPKYVVHNNEVWTLNSKYRKALVDFLRSPSKDFPRLTNWYAVKYYWNNECHLLSYETDTGKLSRPQAYVSGYYDTDENISNPSYVPSYLEMPNYLEMK